MIVRKSELLEDYCQRCGSTVGSLECCMNQPPEDPNDDPSDDQHLER